MTFKLTTGDPAFNPAEPVTINGYRYVPVPPGPPAPEGPSAAELDRRMAVARHERREAKRYVAPPRPGFAASYAPAHCAVRREGDEFVCASCARRWGEDEEKPYCPNDPVWKD